MTDVEILRAAGRLRAARRRRTRKTCVVCGAPFEGIAQRRYCSDACRVRAARQRAKVPAAPSSPESSSIPRGAVESVIDHLSRVRESLMADRVFDDSTEIVRWSRVERTAELLRAGGRYDEAADLVAEYAESTESPWSKREARAFLAELSQIREARMQRHPITDEVESRRPGLEEPGEFPPGSAAAEPPRGEGESLGDYLERIARAMTGGRFLEEDSVEILRRERARRSAELERRVRS